MPSEQINKAEDSGYSEETSDKTEDSGYPRDALKKV